MNRQKIIILRVILLVGTIISLFFVPWLLVKAWILPLPDSVQEQLDEAIDHGFDGRVYSFGDRSQVPGCVPNRILYHLIPNIRTRTW